jgi:PBSX family phage terminase large subunit
VISGPAGTGKTFGILDFFHCLLRDNAGLRFLILRKARASLGDTALETYEKDILPLDGMESLAAGASRRFRHQYVYPSGSAFVTMGLDDPEKIKSSRWDAIYANEATELTDSDWEFLDSRLDRPTTGQPSRLGLLLGDCNPSHPNHWIKRRSDAGELALWPTTHEANPAMFDGRGWTPAGAKYIARLDRLTGVRKLRFRHGIWAGSEGMVYDGFDDSVHVVSPFPIPADWTRLRSIDFGFTNPFVCQWWAIDPDGRMYLYREIYQTRRKVSDHAETINRLSGGERYTVSVADHDAEDRATLQSCGIRTVPAHKSVKPGIEKVQERLALAEDGRPRLYLFRNCRIEADPLLADAKKPTCTAEEFGGYVWEPAKEGRAAKEEPVKLDDHGLDALRYAVAQASGLGTYSRGAY